MSGRINYSGLLIAIIGFFLTRFTVTLVLYEDSLSFYFAGVVPLTLGLGLAAFGVALAVANVDPVLVRTTATWCVIGLVTMFVLVVMTLLGSNPDHVLDVGAARSQTYLANFLIGGSVGGSMTGLYAARNRHQRHRLREQTNRLVTLNRILRHEVLNAVTAIRGYSEIDPTAHPESRSVIVRRSDAIEQTVEQISTLTGRTTDDSNGEKTIELTDALSDSIATIRARYPDIDISVVGNDERLWVDTDDRLSDVFVELLENAIVHGDDLSPRVEITRTPSTVTVTVSDDGPGLPPSQRQLLEVGDVEEYDDPTAGFGLNIVRLLVESYDGSIDTAQESSGMSVRVTVPLARPNQSVGPTRVDLATLRPAFPHLVVAFFGAAVAAVAYGVVAELFGGSIAAIGVFYGTTDPVVGWLTHVFHSVVFGFVYIGILSIVFERFRESTISYLAVGVGWGLVLWIGAAGVIAPLWLRLLGIPSSIPSLAADLLVTHLVWGLTLALFTQWGYQYGIRWASSLNERFVLPAIGGTRWRDGT